MFMVIFPAKASDRAARHASGSVPGAVTTANSEFFLLVHATRMQVKLSNVVRLKCHASV